jgi:phage shock protein C
MSERGTPGGPKRLYRSRTDRKLAGVCGGIANYLGVDPVLIRLLWIFFTLAAGGGVLVYLIAWLVVPEAPEAS